MRLRNGGDIPVLYLMILPLQEVLVADVVGKLSECLSVEILWFNGSDVASIA